MLDVRWLTSAAAGTDTAVYGMLQPYQTAEYRGIYYKIHHF